MLRSVAAVVIGYVVMFALVFGTFSALYMALGPERSFQPGSYEVTTTWNALSIVLSLLAAVVGGVVAVIMAKARKGATALAVVVLILGALMAVPTFTAKHLDTPPVRTGDVPNLEAMMNAQSPDWMAVANPLIGCIGVLIGGRLAKIEEEA